MPHVPHHILSFAHTLKAHIAEYTHGDEPTARHDMKTHRAPYWQQKLPSVVYLNNASPFREVLSKKTSISCFLLHEITQNCLPDL